MPGQMDLVRNQSKLKSLLSCSLFFTFSERGQLSDNAKVHLVVSLDGSRCIWGLRSFYHQLPILQFILVAREIYGREAREATKQATQPRTDILHSSVVRRSKVVRGPSSRAHCPQSRPSSAACRSRESHPIKLPQPANFGGWVHLDSHPGSICGAGPDHVWHVHLLA
jgi:hypothetical protein